MKFYLDIQDNKKLKERILKILKKINCHEIVHSEQAADCVICFPIDRRNLFDKKPLILFGRFSGKERDSTSEIAMIPHQIPKVDINNFWVTVEDKPKMHFIYFLHEFIKEDKDSTYNI